jgi:hypothetical protein
MDAEKKKSVAALIVAKGKPKDEGAGPIEDMEPMYDEGAEDDPGLDVAVEDMMAAFEAKDPRGLKSALMSFIEMCR